jgi:carbon-monoxide dehydrogenase large subunit
MVAMSHGRGQVQEVDLGLKRDGTIVAVGAKITCDAGAYPAIGAFLPFLTRTMGQGVYDIAKVQVSTRWSCGRRTSCHRSGSRSRR